MQKPGEYFLFWGYLIAFILPLSLNGQRTFVHIGEDKGLSSLQVTDLYQDKYGYVWAGTPHGLNRLNGYDCVQYFNLPGDTFSISSNYISPQAFVEDSVGNLWIATHTNGLNFYNRDREEFIHYQADEKQLNSLSMDKLFAIETDAKGGLWIATAGCGFSHYDPPENEFTHWKEDEQHPGLLMGSTVIVCLKRATNSLLWIGTNKGVCTYDSNRKSFDYFPVQENPGNGLSDRYVRTIFEDKKGNIWVGTAKGLNRWDAQNKRFVQYFFSNRFAVKNNDYDYIFDIEEDENGQLWLGTNAGLLLFDTTKNTCEQFLYDPENPFSIKNGPVHTIMKDRDGNCWFGTNYGIYILNKTSHTFNHPVFEPVRQSFAQITQAEGINALAEVNGALWLATQKGLYRYPYKGSLQLVEPGNFTSLYYDNKTDEIYAGVLGNGFYIIDHQFFKIKKHLAKSKIGDAADPYTVKGHRLTSFARDKQGYIWIAADGSLNRYNPVTGRFRKFHEQEKKLPNPSSNTNLHLLIERKGNLWIASMGGLSRLSSAELSKPFDHPDLVFEHFLHQSGSRTSISSNVINCLLESADGDIWVGTNAGLNRYNPKSKVWQGYFKERGIAGSDVILLVEDGQGDIWIGDAHEGLSKYDQKSGRFFHFTKKDGLSTDQFRPNAGLFSKDGLVILGGRTGLVGFRPRDILQDKKQAKSFYFTDFKLFNQSVSVKSEDHTLALPIDKTDRIELPYDQNVVTFQFSALNFLHPEKQIYRYQLIPFQRNWQYIDTKREVTFTNLDPGLYQLKVETSEDGYEWHGKTMAIRIRPPWTRTWWAYALYVIVTGTGLLYLRRYELRRQHEKAEAARLQELDLAKNRLYTNITHEFRTPLTLILGVGEQIRKDPGNWLNEGLELIQRNGRQLLNLVNQMLDLSKLESGHLPLKMVQGDIVAYLHYLMESFHTYAQSKDIQLIFKADVSEMYVDYDPEKLQHTVSNLIANAIKFTPVGGEIEVNIQTGKDNICIQVSDTGPGIPPHHLPYIFDRFYQTEDIASRSEGTGIGLALVKEMVKLMGGDVTVTSPPGKGACFIIHLPVSHVAPQEETTMLPQLADDYRPSSSDTSSSAPDDRNIVLIVEDNTDVITYLKSVLAANYQVLTARNGQEGIDKAFEYIPDIIVSDVMMPIKNGYELCKTLKTDDRTSHIPIVLLTAKADPHSKIEGLTQGADVYLPKPFNQEELLVQLDQLIKLRRQLQERYQHLGQVQPAPAYTAMSLDDLFLKKVLHIVEQEMSDEHFDMPELCALLNMSRSNLFRKLKAITGESPTGFIRSARLKKAKTLLLNTDMNVTEVCFAVGFNSPNYFSRVFQEAFGMAPSEVRRR